MKVFRNNIRFTLVIGIIALLMVGCSAKSRMVQTYEGDSLDDSQIAVLIAPEDVKVVEIDGVKQRDFMLDNLALSYALIPGEHTIVFRYSAIWAKSAKSDSDDESESLADEVESSLHVVTANFSAGEEYTFDFEHPENHSSAKLFAQSFSADLVDESAKVRARSRLYAGVASSSAVGAIAVQSSKMSVGAPAVGAEQPVAVAGGKAGQAISGDAALSRVEALKVLWEKASPEEKKAFLRWAFN